MGRETHTGWWTGEDLSLKAQRQGEKRARGTAFSQDKPPTVVAKGRGGTWTTLSPSPCYLLHMLPMHRTQQKLETKNSSWWSLGSQSQSRRKVECGSPGPTKSVSLSTSATFHSNERTSRIPPHTSSNWSQEGPRLKGPNGCILKASQGREFYNCPMLQISSVFFVSLHVTYVKIHPWFCIASKKFEVLI